MYWQLQRAEPAICLWNIETGQRVGKFICPTPVRSMTWSPDGKILAFDRGDFTRLWNASGSSLGTPTIPGHSPAWSPDGTILANTKNMLVAPTWRPAAQLNLSGNLAWSPDGKALASDFQNGTATIVNAGDVRRLDFSPAFTQYLSGSNSVRWIDDKFLISTPIDGTLRIWDALTGQTQGIILASLAAHATVAIGPQGRFHATPEAESQLVYVIETETGQEILLPEIFAKQYGSMNVLAIITR